MNETLDFHYMFNIFLSYRMDLMRLWSIRLDWLDPIGLVALWRESLLAKAVLEGKTIGYKNHPQLLRFKSYSRP
jgi:hypothetical protein